jgi:hypothetical protein
VNAVEAIGPIDPTARVQGFSAQVPERRSIMDLSRRIGDMGNDATFFDIMRTPESGRSTVFATTVRGQAHAERRLHELNKARTAEEKVAGLIYYLQRSPYQAEAKLRAEIRPKPGA